MVSRSTTRAGVSMAATLWPIRRRRRAGACSGAEFIKAIVFQVRGVGPAHEGQALGCPEQAVDGGVAELPGAWGLQVLASGEAVELVQHAAMGDQHDLLASMARGQFMQGAGDALT